MLQTSTESTAPAFAPLPVHKDDHPDAAAVKSEHLKEIYIKLEHPEPEPVGEEGLGGHSPKKQKDSDDSSNTDEEEHSCPSLVTEPLEVQEGWMVIKTDQWKLKVAGKFTKENEKRLRKLVNEAVVDGHEDKLNPISASEMIVKTALHEALEATRWNSVEKKAEALVDARVASGISPGEEQERDDEYEYDVPVCETVEDNETPILALHDAIENGNAPLVKRLIEQHGTKIISEKDPNTGMTAIQVACHFVYPDIFDAILGANAMNLNESEAPLLILCNKWKESPATVACVKKLLDNPAVDPNKQDDDESTALHLACRHKNREMVKALLACSRVDTTIRDDMGYLAFEFAPELDVSSIQEEIKKEKSAQ